MDKSNCGPAESEKCDRNACMDSADGNLDLRYRNTMAASSQNQQSGRLPDKLEENLETENGINERSEEFNEFRDSTSKGNVDFKPELPRTAEVMRLHAHLDLDQNSIVSVPYPPSASQIKDSNATSEPSVVNQLLDIDDSCSNDAASTRDRSESSASISSDDNFETISIDMDWDILNADETKTTSTTCSVADSQNTKKELELACSEITPRTNDDYSKMTRIAKKNESTVCLVDDYTRTSDHPRIVTNATSATTGKQFLKKIADRYNFEPDSFRLVFKGIIDTNTDKTLEEVGIDFGKGSSNSFIVEGLKGQKPKIALKRELVAPAGLEEPSIEPLSGVEYQNEAMTCALNCLLQVFFLTPELRNGLYNCKFVSTDGMDVSKLFAYQLRKVFGLLQTSSRDSVDSSELTRTLTWVSNKEIGIQDLYNCILNKLTEELKDSEHADLMNGLYQGEYKNTIKCSNCDVTNSREYSFFDISLPVRASESSASCYSSVENALRAFIQPKELDDQQCSNCLKTSGASRTTEFVKFPPLLCLHLMRLASDDACGDDSEQNKLSKRVSVPEKLNLNEIIVINRSESKPDDSSPADKGSAEEAAADDMFELFAIMGDAVIAGHYHVTIRDVDTKKWYCFDDQSVREVNISDVYGDGSSDSKAHVFFYRRIVQTTALQDDLSVRLHVMLPNQFNNSAVISKDELDKSCKL
ncbi:ubiquitin carboxyl-terminal hydrolase 47-like [Planococcus citri]|uniref:ubiquitin carboxyl-terminal hydrolase 47-like n=1 Tax=Planococcus citri TaxID=170843 RepID=UPI0031F9819A